MWWRWFPVITQTRDEILDELNTRFPSHFEISWDTRRLSLNPPQPTQVPYPSSFPKAAQISDDLAYLTPTELNPNTETQVPSVATVITPTHIWVQDANLQWTDAPLTTIFSGNQSWVLNRQTLPDWIEKTRQHSQTWLNQARWYAPPLMALGLLLGRLWSGLVQVILLYFFFKMMGWKWTFGQLWRLSLYLTVTAEVVTQVALLIYGTLNFSVFGLTMWIGLGWLGYRYRR